MTTPLMLRRVQAVEATRARFLGKPFDLGRDDCARMTAFALRQMGYRVSLLKGGRYSTPAGAVRALARLGASSMGEVLDQRFPRIPTAAALVGDLVALPSAHPIGAISLYAGNGVVFGCLEGGVFGDIRLAQAEAAWRAPL